MLPTILLIDDEEEILDFLQRILGDQYNIFRAENAKNALILLETEAIQLVVSDVMMPEMDGFDLCRKITSNTAF